VREVQSTPLVCFRLSKTSTIPPSLCLPSYSMLNHAMCSMYCILPSSTHCTSRTSQEEDPCLFVAGRDSVSRHLFIGLVSIGFQLFVDISHVNMLDYQAISPHFSNSFDHLAHFLVCSSPFTCEIMPESSDRQLSPVPLTHSLTHCTVRTTVHF
jgi:hypothetical protein